MLLQKEEPLIHKVYFEQSDVVVCRHRGKENNFKTRDSFVFLPET